MSKQPAQSTWMGGTIRNYLLPIAVGAAVALSLQHWVVSAAEVISGSMLPTVPYPSYMVVDHLAVELHAPYRGEVVVFHPPVNSVTEDPLLKRIIGLPGETVSVHDGHVYINGNVLNEPYLKGPTLGTFGPYHVPAGCYFMMGDNRQNSVDSRYWANPYVPRANIIGRIDALLWPVKNARMVQ